MQRCMVWGEGESHTQRVKEGLQKEFLSILSENNTTSNVWSPQSLAKIAKNKFFLLSLFSSSCSLLDTYLLSFSPITFL